MSDYATLALAQISRAQSGDDATILGWLNDISPGHTNLNGAGNYVDAVRHGGAATLIAYRYGYDTTISLGDAVERLRPGPADQNSQDYHNNHVGALVGNTARILGLTIQETGELFQSVYNSGGFILNASELTPSTQNIDIGNGYSLSTRGGGQLKLPDGRSILIKESSVFHLAISVNESALIVFVDENGVETRVLLSEGDREFLKKEFTGDADSDIHCFLAGTQISMWDGTRKPIEDIRPGDWVLSFDENGNRVPGRVKRTFQNESKYILDYFGTFVTPGHVYRVVDGPSQGQYMPLIEILRSDAAIVTENGTLLRAATRCEVGSIGDRFVWAVLGEKESNGQVRITDKARLRIGSRVVLADGKTIRFTTSSPLAAGLSATTASFA